MRTPRWVMASYAIIVLAGILAALPNLFTQQQLASLPGWFPKQQVTLGLDLRGGSHLVLEVDAEALKADRLRSLLDEARGALRQELIQIQSVRIVDGSVIVAISDEAQRARAVGILEGLAVPVGGVGFVASQADIDVSVANDRIRVTPTEAGIADRLSSALQQSLEIVRQRVDQVEPCERH